MALAVGNTPGPEGSPTGLKAAGSTGANRAARSIVPARGAIPGRTRGRQRRVAGPGPLGLRSPRPSLLPILILT